MLMHAVNSHYETNAADDFRFHKEPLNWARAVHTVARLGADNCAPAVVNTLETVLRMKESCERRLSAATAC